MNLKKCFFLSIPFLLLLSGSVQAESRHTPLLINNHCHHKVTWQMCGSPNQSVKPNQKNGLDLMTETGDKCQFSVWPSPTAKTEFQRIPPHNATTVIINDMAGIAVDCNPNHQTCTCSIKNHRLK